MEVILNRGRRYIPAGAWIAISSFIAPRIFQLLYQRVPKVRGYPCSMYIIYRGREGTRPLMTRANQKVPSDLTKKGNFLRNNYASCSTQWTDSSFVCPPVRHYFRICTAKRIVPMDILPSRRSVLQFRPKHRTSHSSRQGAIKLRLREINQVRRARLILYILLILVERASELCMYPLMKHIYLPIFSLYCMLNCRLAINYYILFNQFIYFLQSYRR